MAKQESANILATVVIALVVGAVAFFGGMQYQKSKAPTFARANGFFGNGAGNVGGFRQGGGNGAGRQGGNGNGFRPIAGQISSVDATSITVKLPDGSSKIVMVPDNTAINKEEKATKADLKTGTTIAIFGQTNTDGSVTATNIQLNPTLRMAGSSGTPVQQPPAQ